MATEIRVPTLGESVTEATVGQWYKQAGDAVTADEPLVELETDKVTVEVPAPASGVLSEIVVKAGDTVAVGSVLGAIASGDGNGAGTVTAEMPPSPAARKYLAETGLSPASVVGSGRRGQVLKQDELAQAGA